MPISNPFLLIGIQATNLIFEQLKFRDLVALQRVCRFTDAALDREKLKKQCKEEVIPLCDVDRLVYVSRPCPHSMYSFNFGYYLCAHPRYPSKVLRRRFVEPPESTLDFWDAYNFFGPQRMREDWVYEDGTIARISTKKTFLRGLYCLRLGKKEDARRQAVIDSLTQTEND